jgi:hypothetical protein
VAFYEFGVDDPQRALPSLQPLAGSVALLLRRVFILLEEQFICFGYTALAWQTGYAPEHPMLLV